VLVLVLFAAPGARALTDEEVFRNFRFNLINPGARSLALGGAFISLADDATAAQANPAGLAFLIKWEAFAEVRSIDNAAQSTVRAETLPTGIETSVAVGTDIDDVVSPSFLSGVVNFDNWSLGISRQEVLNVKNKTLSSFAFTFPDSPGKFLAEGQGAIDVDIVNYNVSAGVRIGTNWGIGATATYSELTVDSRVTNIVLDILGNISGDIIGGPILQPAVNLQTQISDSDSDFAYSLGVLYREQGKWHAGAVFRKTADFRVEQRLGLDPGELDLFGVKTVYGDRDVNRFNLPDSFGLGGSLVLLNNQQLTLALDVERIFYSNLKDNFLTGVNTLTDFDAVFDVDDGTDFRFGAEYVIAPGKKRPPLALRAGTFVESASTVYARSTGTESFATEEVFSKGDDQWHGTVGLGVVFKRTKIDMAADFSETDNEYLVSVIFQGK
jgi:long-subunit fatty acid transport protein